MRPRRICPWLAWVPCVRAKSRKFTGKSFILHNSISVRYRGEERLTGQRTTVPVSQIPQGQAHKRSFHN